MGGSCWGEQSVWPWGREAGGLYCPLRPVEVTGASPSAAGEPGGYADMLSSAPSHLSLWIVKVSMGSFDDGRWGSRELMCWEAWCF